MLQHHVLTRYASGMGRVYIVMQLTDFLHLERWLIIVLSFLTASACSTLYKEPTADLKIIYEKSAQYHLPDRNPVIVIPGILGSKLIDETSGRTVWGAFNPESVNPAVPNDARLISLPIGADRTLSELQDSVRPNGVLDKVRIEFFGIPMEIRAYAGILATLGVGGYRDESLGLAINYGDDHFTCFQFDYDWRRDNVENARRLKAFIEEKRDYVKNVYNEKYGLENVAVKFDIVAHSMGGLVTRYFLRYGDADLPIGEEQPVVTWAGAKYVERAILVGTPNAGSINAFTQLIDGYDVGRPILPYYNAALLGTFPALYELLPRPRHKAIVWKDSPNQELEEFYDPALWERYNWGIASKDKRDLEFLRNVLPGLQSDESRRQVALALQRKILERTKKFHESLDVPALTPQSLKLYLVAGDAEDTAQKIAVDKLDGSYEIIEHGPGDGRVLRASALNDERVGGNWKPELVSPIDWSGVMFLFADHIGLTQDEAFADNVLYLLLEDPRR